jgi:hypothetical protein
MLLNRTIASIPSTSRQSISITDDLQNPPVILVSSPIPSSLQYFNIRVTERLHRYRSLKRQWNEATSTNQSDNPIPSPIEIEQVTHEQLIKDYVNITEIRDKNHIEFDPLHSQIQNDLIKLRRLIKSRQKKLTENASLKTNLNHRSIVESLQKTNMLDRVKISGSPMRPSTFPESQKQTTNPREPSGCKQQTINHIFNMYRTRVNHQSLPPDSLIQGVPLSKQNLIIPPKTTSNINVKQTPARRSPMPIIIKKKQTTSIKQETSVSPTRRQPPSTTEPTTTCPYTYAASTSSTSPTLMKLNRKTSILPILLTSSSCVGAQQRRSHSGKTREVDDHSYNLQDYKRLVTHLPKPVVQIAPRYDQGDYGILFEQLDHIRERMPNANVYENYARGS